MSVKLSTKLDRMEMLRKAAEEKVFKFPGSFSDLLMRREVTTEYRHPTKTDPAFYDFYIDSELLTAELEEEKASIFRRAWEWLRRKKAYRYPYWRVFRNRYTVCFRLTDEIMELPEVEWVINAHIEEAHDALWLAVEGIYAQWMGRSLSWEDYMDAKFMLEKYKIRETRLPYRPKRWGKHTPK